MTTSEVDALVNKLTLEDYQLIMQQLINQEADTREEKNNFVNAYAVGRSIAEAQIGMLGEGDVASLVLKLAKLTYPRENQSGLRTFQPRHGKTGEPIGTSPGLALQRDMEQWCAAFSRGDVDPDELYFWFEQIHPFHDGNGRVGHIMWALDVTRKTGRWPMRLPPEYRPPKVNTHAATTSAFVQED